VQDAQAPHGGVASAYSTLGLVLKLPTEHGVGIEVHEVRMYACMYDTYISIYIYVYVYIVG
jgi:hypothetical protein